MTLGDLIHIVVFNDQARYLAALVIANAILGVVGAIITGKFDLTRLSDYARTRLLPVFVVYGVGALVSWAAPDDPILGHLRDIVFATEAAVMLALLLANLEPFGIKLPPTVTGKTGPAPINAITLEQPGTSTDVPTR